MNGNGITTSAAAAGGAAYLIPIYALYTAAAVGLTAALARTLFRNGSVFLRGVFEESDMAEAINRLLVVGFYMLNLGYALLIFKTQEAATARQAVELLVQKLGVLLATLGIIHFANMYVFVRIRRPARAAVLPIPVAPQVQMTWGAQ